MTSRLGYASELSTYGNCLNSFSQQQKISGKSKSNSAKVTIEYVNHSTFKITSPDAVVIVVDFAGVIGSEPSPDIVTLNHTPKDKLLHIQNPEPKTILEAWSNKTNSALQHIVTKNDVSIKNVGTDIYDNGVLNTENGNSIFVFKIAGLCIGHLGNLQHSLNDEKLKSIGSLDIVMVPVDSLSTSLSDGPIIGKNKLKTQELVNLLMQLKSKIIIPMHWESDASKQNFMAEISPYFSISGYPTDSLKVSTKTLPNSPTIVTMIPQYDQNEYNFDRHH